MREVKTKPKFKYDFCRRTSMKEAMKLHEGRCYRNPNRYCDGCENTGRTSEFHENGPVEIDCP